MTEGPTVAVVGCGALAEMYYAPSLLEIERAGRARVAAIFDPTAARLEEVGKLLPNAKRFSRFDDVVAAKPALAIVASPAQFHSEQSIALLKAGCGVLCEKPMASDEAGAQRMIEAARESGSMLAIGLFRRFFPALRMVKDYVAGGALGKAVRFEFTEGGVFEWPAQSASFFQKKSAKGGVFLDLGVHMLDLAVWWFGEPAEVEYQDDAMGGLEINARARLKFADGLAGVAQLSRDWELPNEYRIEFERGTVIWKVGEANRLQVSMRGQEMELRGEVVSGDETGLDYSESFVAQILNCLAAAQGREGAVVSGEEGIRSLRLIDRCYKARTLLPMPWLTENEAKRAGAIAKGIANFP